VSEKVIVPDYGDDEDEVCTVAWPCGNPRYCSRCALDIWGWDDDPDEDAPETG
jgi:hypothetical protein